jgi:hypothetical protein
VPSLVLDIKFVNDWKITLIHLFTFKFSIAPSREEDILEKLLFHFSFLILWTVSRPLWEGDQPAARQLRAQDNTQNKGRQTLIFRVGSEPTTPVFRRAKSVNALDRAATLIGGR